MCGVISCGFVPFGDVVIANLIGRNNVVVATNTPGHVAAKTARLKEEAYATCYPGDLLYPSALEVVYALHPLLNHFLGRVHFVIVYREAYPPIFSLLASYTTGVCCTLESSNIHYSL